MEKEYTGYPSIDRPWLKYYTKEQIDAEMPKCKIYEYIWNSNKEHLDRVALNYYDRSITYKELFYNIERSALAFQSIGVKKGEIVPVLSVTIPETIYTLYGLNRIGAVSNMIDPRTSTDGIHEYIKEVNAKTVVIIDVAYEKLIKALENTMVENIIVMSPMDSLPLLKKYMYKVLKGIKVQYSSKVKRWNEFILNTKEQRVEDSLYRENECCVIVHTGGTTGKSKGVKLSNDNLNCSAFQGFNSSLDFKRKHRWANIMPPFIAYGVGNGLHLPLSVGMEVILIPKFDPHKFDELLLKYHPSHMAGVPSHYENLINSSKMQKADLSYLISPIVGGDSMKIELEEKVNYFLRSHGVKNHVIKGYGMTEVSAADSVCVSNNCNKTGSVGIPFAHTIISIFDSESGKELSYMQKGEVCMTGPNTMIGYFGDAEETDKILRKHSDGRLWVHSGDLGYMDEDGILFIDGRLKRMIVRYDGFKVFPNIIENIVLKNQSIKNCCVVGIDDDEHTQGKMPAVFAVLKKENNKKREKICMEIMSICEKELPEYAQPKKIEFIEELPLTPIGKIDYLALEEM